MSEQTNVALVGKLYAAFGTGDVQTILDNVSPDAEWINHGPATIPYAGSRKGHVQIREFFEAIGQSTIGAKVTTTDFVAHGDSVVSFGRYTATVRDTGAKIDSPVAQLFTVRNGKVVRWEGFSDTAHIESAHKGRAAAGR
jgi:ketosteroid isomerase-like protein